MGRREWVGGRAVTVSGRCSGLRWEWVGRGVTVSVRCSGLRWEWVERGVTVCVWALQRPQVGVGREGSDCLCLGVAAASGGSG